MSDARLEFVQSGGIGGLTMYAHLDAGELSPGEASAVKAVMDERGKRAAEHGRPDAMQYDFVLVEDGARRELTVWEDSMPGTLTPLVRRLQSRAVPGPA